MHPERSKAILVRHVLDLIGDTVGADVPVPARDYRCARLCAKLDRFITPLIVLRFRFFTAPAVFALTVVAILAAPATRNDDSDLIYYDNVRDDSGYSFSYKTKDGQFREEQGYIDPESGILRVTGLYRYVGTDGETYEYNYEADENGYRIVDKPPPAGAPISNTVLLSLVG
uniref:Uncharacterized protein n=1 Tax=Anopheles epiroticus TaxID=199890 RepID=A0A182P5L3_9DIPT